MKPSDSYIADKLGSRSLTGAWIETNRMNSFLRPEKVAPLRGRGLKLDGGLCRRRGRESLPYGGVD